MRWINATDRLPEQAGRYFAFNRDGKKRTCIYYPQSRQFSDAVVKWLDESEVNVFSRIKAFFKQYWHWLIITLIWVYVLY